MPFLAICTLQVVKIDVEDHNPPLLSQIVSFLETAAAFLEVWHVPFFIP